MNKREHFECWFKQLRPCLPRDYNESGDYYYDDTVDLSYRAWQASPKTRPTETSKITKEQIAAMKVDTTDLVDNLRGIYQNISSPYPVSPLMLKAADEIERLRVAFGDIAAIMSAEEECRKGWVSDFHVSIQAIIDSVINKKPAEAG